MWFSFCVTFLCYFLSKKLCRNPIKLCDLIIVACDRFPTSTHDRLGELDPPTVVLSVYKEERGGDVCAVGCWCWGLMVVGLRAQDVGLCDCSKATNLDGMFLPTWINFGNAFAAQEEGDQAKFVSVTILPFNSQMFFMAGNMSPYVVLTYRTQEQQSSVASGQGSEPEWNETFVFSITGDVSELALKLMDKDTFSSDDFVGEATMCCSSNNSNFSQFVGYLVLQQLSWNHKCLMISMDSNNNSNSYHQ